MAASGLNLAKLALADPPCLPRGENDEVARAEQAARMRVLNERGDYEASVTFFLKDYGLPGGPGGDVSVPGGAVMLARARALPYDYAVLGDGLVPTELAAGVDVPTLVLAAEATPETARDLADAMPNARFRAMDASVHEPSPEALAPVLKEFFGRP